MLHFGRSIVLEVYLSPPPPSYTSLSDWPRLCLFCCYQPSCAVIQQSWLWAFLFHNFFNFTPPSPELWGGGVFCFQPLCLINYLAHKVDSGVFLAFPWYFFNFPRQSISKRRKVGFLLVYPTKILVTTISWSTPLYCSYYSRIPVKRNCLWRWVSKIYWNSRMFATEYCKV